MLSLSNPKAVEVQCKITHRNTVKKFLQGVAVDLVKKSEQLLKVEKLRKVLILLFLLVSVGMWNRYFFTMGRMEAVPLTSKRIKMICM